MTFLESERAAEERCGTIAIVGRPNVGKSTLLNALIGLKVSIVSRKAQTTRHRILGVLTQYPHQFVFIDTPGFQRKHASAMNQLMNRVVTQSLSDVDVIVHVIEAGKWTEADATVSELLPTNVQKILVLNKIDRLKNKEQLLPFLQSMATKEQKYDAYIPLSAEKNQSLTNLLLEISTKLPAQSHFYEADMLTDRSMRFLTTEIIREKIFRLVGDELPYACTVVIEQWEESSAHLRVAACVFVERESHKPILLGQKGMHIKRIATEARQDIVKLVEKSVYLEVYVKVRKGWSSSQSTLREFGYDEQ